MITMWSWSQLSSTIFWWANSQKRRRNSTEFFKKVKLSLRREQRRLRVAQAWSYSICSKIQPNFNAWWMNSRKGMLQRVLSLSNYHILSYHTRSIRALLWSTLQIVTHCSWRGDDFADGDKTWQIPPGVSTPTLPPCTRYLLLISSRPLYPRKQAYYTKPSQSSPLGANSSPSAGSTTRPCPDISSPSAKVPANA